MAEPPANTFSGIFVSYRRDDTSGHAGRLSDKLVDHFGKDRIFMDIDTIEPGEDFVTVIENAVGSCEILIAVIGRQWLKSAGRSTGRLDNPNDFVRLEIATALRRDIRVIPVLVQRASMPKPEDLPEDLAKFSRRNAIELTDPRWQTDVEQLIGVLERVLAKREEARRLAAAAQDASEKERERRELKTDQIEATRRAEGEDSLKGEEAQRRLVGEATPRDAQVEQADTDARSTQPRRRPHAVLGLVAFSLIALLSGIYIYHRVVSPRAATSPDSVPAPDSVPPNNLNGPAETPAGHRSEPNANAANSASSPTPDESANAKNINGGALVRSTKPVGVSTNSNNQSNRKREADKKIDRILHP